MLNSMTTKEQLFGWGSIMTETKTEERMTIEQQERNKWF